MKFKAVLDYLHITLNIEVIKNLFNSSRKLTVNRHLERYISLEEHFIKFHQFNQADIKTLHL